MITVLLCEFESEIFRLLAFVDDYPRCLTVFDVDVHEEERDSLFIDCLRASLALNYFVWLTEEVLSLDLLGAIR